MGLRFTGLRLAVLVLAVGIGILFAIPVRAQGRQGHDSVPPPSDLSAPEHGDRTDILDTLFEALKIAPDRTSANAIEDRIRAVWMVSRSDTCNLLMSRVKAATDAKDYDLAIALLDAIIEINPDYVEAWTQRATVYFLKNDYGHSIADIREVLAREPRHFGALSDLGFMLQELGDDKDALEAFRRALAIDPYLERVPDIVKTLREKLEGRDI